MPTVSDFYRDQSQIEFETWKQHVNALLQEVDASPTLGLKSWVENRDFEPAYTDGYTPVEAAAECTEDALARDIASLTVRLETAQEALVRLAASTGAAEAAAKYNNYAGSWETTATRLALTLGQVLEETGHLNEDKVTVGRDMVQRLIDSMLVHTEPLRHTNNAVDCIDARRQIGNPLVRSGEQLPTYMYDGRFEPDQQYDLHTKEVRNLMYRLTQVLEKGEKAQSDIWEEDVPALEELQTQEYDVTYIQRVDEQATVTVEAASEEEAIRKAKESDYKGEMETTFVSWIHDSFKHPEVEPKGETDNS